MGFSGSYKSISGSSKNKDPRESEIGGGGAWMCAQEAPGGRVRRRIVSAARLSATRSIDQIDHDHRRSLVFSTQFAPPKKMIGGEKASLRRPPRGFLLGGNFAKTKKIKNHMMIIYPSSKNDFSIFEPWPPLPWRYLAWACEKWFFDFSASINLRI